MTTLTIDDFVSRLPKAELHVHLVGSASVPTVLELARRHPEQGVPTEEGALRSYYEFSDFAHFIDVYISVNSLVQQPEDIVALIDGIAGDLAAQQVRYAELTVTPDSHLQMGIAAPEVAAALVEARVQARRDHAVELAWIFDIPGELGLPSGERTIDWVEAHAPEGTIGFGLGGPEAGVGRPQFAEVFARARAMGLRSVPHAGETTGAQTVWDAVRELHADRIGHGVSAIEDDALVAHLAEHQIALEMCPTSNLCTKSVTELGRHPLPRLREAGVPVTLNSDDPGMFSTTLNGEYVLAHEAWGMDEATLADLARAAVRVSYASPDLKRRLLAEIEEVCRYDDEPASKRG